MYAVSHIVVIFLELVICEIFLFAGLVNGRRMRISQHLRLLPSAWRTYTSDSRTMVPYHQEKIIQYYLPVEPNQMRC